MRLPYFIALLGGTLACTACVSTAAIRAEAQAVFREHNRVAGEVMLSMPELDPDADATGRLMNADKAMLEACEPLNDLAVAHREGRRVTVRERLALPATIDACRDATAAVDALLTGA